MKRLVLCIDGTWCAQEGFGQASRATNVLRFTRTIAKRDPSGTPQVALYLPGVGSSAAHMRRLAGVTGIGMSDLIAVAYHFVAANYRPGDQLYIVGFSRGAFAAQSLAGFIARFGLRSSVDAGAFARDYTRYRKGERDEKAAGPEVQFLGLWDPVGALGVPIPGVRRFSRRYVGFHETELPNNVVNAAKALALHEFRAAFEPVLWGDDPDVDSVETWFSGSHADIGGGLDTEGLSGISLLWMIKQAKRAGLAFDPGAVAQISHDPLTPPFDSWRGVYRLQAPAIRKPGVGQTLHPSARMRMTKLSESQRLRFVDGTPTRRLARLIREVETEAGRLPDCL